MKTARICMRRQVCLTQEEDAALEAEAREQETSASEIVRRLIKPVVVKRRGK